MFEPRRYEIIWCPPAGTQIVEREDGQHVSFEDYRKGVREARISHTAMEALKDYLSRQQHGKPKELCNIVEQWEADLEGIR